MKKEDIASQEVISNKSDLTEQGTEGSTNEEKAGYTSRICVYSKQVLWRAIGTERANCLKFCVNIHFKCYFFLFSWLSFFFDFSCWNLWNRTCRCRLTQGFFSILQHHQFKLQKIFYHKKWKKYFITAFWTCFFFAMIIIFSFR